MKRLYFLKQKNTQTNEQQHKKQNKTKQKRQINESGYTKGKYNLKVQLCKYNWYQAKVTQLNMLKLH